MAGGLGEATFADLDTAASWQDHVDHAEFPQLTQNSTWLAAKTLAFAHLAKRLPQHLRQEADKDLSQDGLFFLVPDRSDLEVALADAEGRFRLGQLYVRLP